LPLSYISLVENTTQTSRRRDCQSDIRRQTSFLYDYCLLWASLAVT